MKHYVKDYPRPQMIRAGWENLNGTWAFAFDDGNCGEAAGWHSGFEKQKDILVPFTYETKASGIGDESVHENIWYSRSFEVAAGALDGKRLVLHFEGSDYHTKVWVNGVFVGSHTGGYARFSFDVTNAAKEGANSIVVKVEDSLDPHQLRGKQRWIPENFGCWYVQTTGIWKTVWLEYVPEVSISHLRLTPELAANSLKVDYEVSALPKDRKLRFKALVTFDGEWVTEMAVPVRTKTGSMTIDVASTEIDEWSVKTWSPENPNLYDVTFFLMEGHDVVDSVDSYFGMREIRIDGSNILLNGAPLYQRLILDQGYWKDSHLTPPSEEALIEDIDKIHALGYNGLRKHQKTEDERFLYWCDVKGMLVWSEVAANYLYSADAAAQFTCEWLEIVKQNYSHPCIITWTPFNESWGVPKIETNVTQQKFTEAIYYLTKSIDPNRPVIVNDGWEHTISDIITLHDYEAEGRIFKDRYLNFKDQIMSTEVYHCNGRSAFANGFGYRGQPVIISEFGGIAFNNGEAGWGYGDKVADEKDFIRRFDEITTAIKEIPYVCGYCYTQVSDVQQEINGLMDMERNFKVDSEIIKEINTRSVGSLTAHHY